MRKLFFLLVLVSGMLAAQTPNATNTQTFGKFLKLSKVPAGLGTDNVLVRGTDGIVKFVPRSEFAGGGIQVNADWNATSGPSEIFNKPIIPTVVPQINSDWNSLSGVSQIINKPQFRTINGQSIFGSTDLTISGGTSIAHLEFDNTQKTVWNNGNGDIMTNLSFGQNALKNNITGYSNVCYGLDTLPANTDGVQNTAIGVSALFRNTLGNKNTVLGISTMSYNLQGGQNIAIGSFAGVFFNSSGQLSNPNDSVFIGANTKALSNNGTNEIVIGTDVVGAGSNTATLGNASIIKTILSGVIQKRALDTAPASATAPGTVGEIRITATHVYWCIATNTWIRAAGTTW